MNVDTLLLAKALEKTGTFKSEKVKEKVMKKADKLDSEIKKLQQEIQDLH